MKTATIATSTVTAPIRTGLAASRRGSSLMARAGSRGGAAGAVSVVRRLRGDGRGRGVVVVVGAAARRIWRRHARLRRAEELVADAQRLVVRLGGVRAAVVDDHAQAQHVADVVERVRAERLPVEVVPDRFHPGEPGAAARDVRLVRGGRIRGGGTRVGLDGAAAVVDRLEELAQRLRQPGSVARKAAQLADLLRRSPRRPGAPPPRPRRAT